MGRIRLRGQIVFGATLLLLVTGTLCAQDALPIPTSSTTRFGGPRDWSNRHVIYTRNGSFEDMLKLRDDPRFMHSILLHYMREHPNQSGLSANAGLNETGLDENSLSADTYGAKTQELERMLPWGPIRFPHIKPSRNKNSKVDWSVSLGPTAGMAIGESPAVYTYNYATPSCSALTAAPPVVGDFIVYTINAVPSTAVPGQANLVGLTNLYTAGDGTGFCSGTGPSFLFSYAIGTGGSPLSPVLSLDGTRVAWIENRTATDSYLHITTWVANQGISATDPATGVTGTFSNGTCTPAGSSCDDAIEYTNATYPGCPAAYIAGNGHSDLYVDYSSDAGFISANNGLLYHIKNIFSTTTTPSVDFCIPVNPTFEPPSKNSTAMSGPVYDLLLKEVFITDSEKIYAYTVNAASFTAAAPASFKFGNSYNYQTGPGPLLDAFNGYLYVFSTDDTAGGTSVTQIPTSLATGSGVLVGLGNKSTNANQILFYGAFDNNYYNNGPKSAASTLYTCGTDSTTTAQDLFAISFSPATGLANTTPAMSYNRNVNLNGTTPGLCSPITEFFDGTTDRIFVGMGMPGAATGTNIVTMWNVTSQLTSASATPSASATNYFGGTSGISADNNASGTAQAQSIYFSTEAAGLTSTLVPGTGYNVNGIYTDGQPIPCTGGLDNDGNAYSSNLLGASVTWNGTTFTLGPANSPDAWSDTTIALPAGQFSTLVILAAAVNVTQTGTTQTFTVNYTDTSTTTFTQNFSDWYNPLGFNGESIAKSMAYRDTCSGAKDPRTFDIYGYSFAINPNKTVSSITLPATPKVVVLAAALSSNCGGADYCAVKLTQTLLK
jgi:hypothetical protein